MKLEFHSESRRLLYPLAVSHTVVRSVRVHRFEVSCPTLHGWSETATGPWDGVGDDAAHAAATLLAAELDGRRIGGADEVGAFLGPHYGRLPAAITAGVEMALLDGLAAAAGLPLWRYLGLPRPPRAPLFQTVDLLSGDRPWRRAAGRYKVKLGGPDDADVIASCGGAGSEFLFDVNSGWEVEEYDRHAPALRVRGPIGVEDPVRSLADFASRRAAWRRDRVFLDETVRDCTAVREHAAAAAGVNFKLLKFGGLLPVLEGIGIARSLGAEVVIGCFIEPERSIAYAAALTGLADHVDLDGDAWLTGSARSHAAPDGAPGIGGLR